MTKKETNQTMVNSTLLVTIIPYDKTWLNLDYELQQGTKLDYLFFESSRALKPSELHLLKNRCEQEQSHTHYSDAFT